MKHLIIIALLSTIIGCSVDNETVNTYTQEQYDEGTGLTLLPSENMWVSFDEIVNIYVSTEACMGMTARGTTVRFVSFEEYYNADFENQGAWGVHTKGFIDINTYIGTNPYQGFKRDKRTDTEALQHEFVHAILFFNGLPPTDGQAIFSECGVGVNTYN